MVNSTSWHQYVAETGIHVIDCSGRVDLATGMARLELLEQAFAALAARGGVRRVLIDFRETEWDSEETHRALSRATRERFGLTPENAGIRFAIVNQRWGGRMSDNEHWFLVRDDALGWLSQ
jgi:hypothetical protein